MLQDALDAGVTLEWVDADEIPDEVWSVTPYGMGSSAPPAQETLEEIECLRLVEKLGDRSMEEAVKELGGVLGEPIGCIVPGELGAGNTAAALVTGARLGIPVVDGDYCGRAVPEEMQGTPYLNGKNSWPLVCVDGWGDVVIIKYAVDPHMLERIGRMVSVAAYLGTSVASTPLRAGEMKEIVVRDTLSKCLTLGRAVREARESGRDPIEAILEVTGGWRLFEGLVSGKTWEDRDGYLFGTTYIQGAGEYEGHSLDVWFKNENQVSWLDGDPWVCSPDLISLVYADTGEGARNAAIAESDQVVVIGIKGLEAFRTESGLNQAAGPRYFGFDIDYVPIEELVADRG